MQKAHIGIRHLDMIENSFFEEFSSEISHSHLYLHIEGVPEPGSFASVEWFIPTAIAAFVGKAYFEEFLKEMGKEHYQALKSALARLTKKTISQPRLEPVLMGTSGKIKQNNPYTMAFSIIAEANDSFRFKLLLPKHTDQFNYDFAVAKFMEFIADYHLLGIESKAHSEIEKSRSPGGTVLVYLNPETDEIEWRDHIPPEVRERMNVQQGKQADA